MIPLGTPAPDFRLPDPTGALHGLADAESAQAVLVVFMCNHCPFVVHIAAQLAESSRDWQARGLAIFAINSNDVTSHPADAPEAMAAEIEARNYTFPYLFDEDQSVAKAYSAACTPDFFLFDGDRRLVYRGQFCDSRPGTSFRSPARIWRPPSRPHSKGGRSRATSDPASAATSSGGRRTSPPIERTDELAAGPGGVKKDSGLS